MDFVSQHLTDVIVLTLLTYYFLRGMVKGFLRTVLGPISFILAIIASHFYYLQSKNFMMALSIGIVGPILINLILSLFVKFWNKKIDDKEPLSAASRLTGGVLSLSWRGSMLFLVIILISMIPGKISWFTQIKDNVLDSRSYALLSKIVGDKMPGSGKDLSAMNNVLRNPNISEDIKDTQEYKDVMKDKKVKDLLKDQNTVNMIRDKDYLGLLRDKKIQSILTDDKLIAKILTLNNVIRQQPPVESNLSQLPETQSFDQP